MVSVLAQVVPSNNQGPLIQNEFFGYKNKRYKLNDEIDLSKRIYRLEFEVQKFNRRYLLYEKVENKISEWLKSMGLLFWNLVHNIVYKYIMPLSVVLLDALGAKIPVKFHSKCQAIIQRNTCFKALLIIIPQFLLYLASILSFGLFSPQLNRCAGILEWWANDGAMQSFENKTLSERLDNAEWAASCQQPNFIANSDFDPDLEEVRIKNICMPNQIHSMLPKIVARDYNTAAIREENYNFNA
ncbi:MAG: hypothetical protein S4CHLAM20_13160 [Chlamydiia bacterium]|nr:hypothetical protein [Chlamydiia bacterium]